ncbi:MULTISPECIES: hypothetical protein [Streptomyces violaceusniger group]|uniref:Uncharacterized protein n=1 Tax=Streptomyces antimycoticus TaxID=68175 RepID=A0ABD5J3F0_9ACTN|nr:hypothetical protein [Streptomyces sp. DSM 41602]
MLPDETGLAQDAEVAGEHGGGDIGSTSVPGDLMAEYYRQWASAGLIISECTYPDHGAQGWVGVPGIGTDEEAAGCQG